MNTEKNLDKQIKQALENLQAKYDGRMWEAFEQRLDEECSDTNTNGTSPVGTDLSFDEVISGKLNRIEVPLAAGDWSMLEKMIEADETAEQLENEAVVDNFVSERLENFQVAYQPHHWQMMANRLEEEFFVRYHLYRCKAAEAALMLLMLFTIARFSPVLDGATEGSNFKANWPTTPTAPLPVEQGNPTAKSPIAQAQQLHPDKMDASFGPLATVRASRAFSNNTSDDFVATMAFAEAGGLTNNLISNGANDNYLPLLGISSVQSDLLSGNLFEAIAEKRFLRSSLRTPGMDNRNTLLFASLDAQATQTRFAWEVPQLPQSVFFDKNWSLRISAFTNTDIAFVLTPPTTFSMYDTLIASGYDTTLASGYGGGIAIHLKKRKWEIQMGATYSFKRYVPNSPAIFVETVNYIIRRDEQEFNGVQLNTLQVPLHVNYHFKDQGKWRLYGSIGASGHLITTSTSQANDGDLAPTTATFAILPPSTATFSKAADAFAAQIVEQPRSNSQTQHLPNGFMEGGHIRDNFYLTANIGLGVERYVSPRWSLFLQPNYQHQFFTGSIGVNSERFYNFSFQFGTKVGLK